MIKLQQSISETVLFSDFILLNEIYGFIFHILYRAFIYIYGKTDCSGQKKPDSWGRHSESLNNLGSGNLEGGGLRKGRSVYKQPGTKVDGSCHS